jgi:hypothetical protein
VLYSEGMYKRSKWQGQPDALRAANRRRTAEALARQDAAKLALVPAPECSDHAWRNWEYVLGHTHEVRECRDCGYAEMRKVTL